MKGGFKSTLVVILCVLAAWVFAEGSMYVNPHQYLKQNVQVKAKPQPQNLPQNNLLQNPKKYAPKEGTKKHPVIDETQASLKPTEEAQEAAKKQSDKAAAKQGKGHNKKLTKVYLEHADLLSYDKLLNPDAQILTGNVCFRHDNAYMHCDSAFFYEASNSFEAFNNVKMTQGDTLFVYGNYLFYDGNSRIAYLRENVRMVDRDVTLFTDSLNYERLPNIGYYFDGGLIVDTLNQLSSYYGQYSPETKLCEFNDSVRLDNPDFTLYSDTLHYNTITKIATILGPSVIATDSGTVYSSRGWYDTQKNTSALLDRSIVFSGSRTLTGDTIYYNKGEGTGEVHGNMILEDTVKKAKLEGQYGFYNEKTDYALATDSALLREYSQGDTLYLHADTLRLITIDSTKRDVYAYRGVRFYRSDLQGVCDSMMFQTQDSVLRMFDDPVLWNDQYQLYGDTIEVYFRDTTVDHVHVKRYAFAIAQVDTASYNQLKGDDLKAYFDGKTVNQIEVSGSAESIFYPAEKDGSMVGLNKTQSGFLTIWLKDNKLDKLKIWPNPVGSLTPIPDLTLADKTLKDFYWYDYLRPLNSADVFKAVKKKAAEKPKRSNKFVH